MPKHHMVIPHYLGRSQEVDIEIKNAEVNAKDLNGQELSASGSPPEDIPLLLPQEANGMIAPNLNNTLGRMYSNPMPLLITWQKLVRSLLPFTTLIAT